MHIPQGKSTSCKTVHPILTIWRCRLSYHCGSNRPIMKKNILFALLFGLSIAGYSQRGVDPKNIMRQVIQAMGGDSLLHTIQTIAYNGYAYRNAIDQSERPDGPFIFEP